MKTSFGRRIVYVTLTAILLLGFSHAFAQTSGSSKPVPKTEPVTLEQREAIEKVIREYLLKNPSIIREAIAALQAQEEREQQDLAAVGLKTHRSDIYLDPDSPVTGNPKGDVTLVVFFDYNCGYCKKSLPDLKKLVAKDPLLRVIYKEFPILGPQSEVAAQAALAAARQGKYVEFHNALLASAGVGGETIRGISDRLRLNYATLQKDMADPKLNQALSRNLRLATALAIEGTPAYIIGDQLFPGAIDMDSMTKVVAAERAKRADAKGAKESAEPKK